MTFFPLRYLMPAPPQLMNTLNTIFGGNSVPVNLQFDKNIMQLYTKLLVWGANGLILHNHLTGEVLIRLLVKSP